MRLVGLVMVLDAGWAGAAALHWLPRPFAAAPASGLEVRTAVVEPGDIRRVVAATGSLRPLVTVEVGSQLSGQIAELMVDYNDPVRAGDVLARIDPRTFEALVKEMAAGVAVAEANLALQRADRQRRQTALDQAVRELERVRTLRRNGTVVQAALDDAQTMFDTAEADVLIADAQIANAEDALAQRRAMLDSARIDLERTVIRSPIDGVVIDRAVALG